jgi:two-component system response regulator DegU
MIRVAIIDDNPEFREHLVKLFENEPDISVEAVAESVSEGIRAVEEKKPEVILMDGKEPFTENLEATSTVVARFPDTRIIVLSKHSNNSVAASCCKAWACFFLCENCSDIEILDAVRKGH